MVFLSHRKRLLCAALCVGSLLAASSGHEPPPADLKAPSYSAYYEGAPVTLMLAPPLRGQHSFKFGSWHLGARLRDSRPSDRRPNLYLVMPGDQHRSDAGDEFNHNAVLSIPPPDTGDMKWDVFWAVVLDPALGRDLRSERDLLVAGASSFTSSDVFQFNDLPGAGFLRDMMGMNSLADLAPYRRKDGRLPRVIIIPSGYAIRASKAPAATP